MKSWWTERFAENSPTTGFLCSLMLKVIVVFERFLVDKANLKRYWVNTTFLPTLAG
jgi:hypothetical protein